MNITMTLCIANAEVNRLFTRKMPDNTLFYDRVIQKINALYKRAREQQAYALITLNQFQVAILELTHELYDAIDNYEGLLERKKYLKGKTFSFPERFQQALNFDSSIAADLAALFEVFDRLISTMKIVRHAGCFMKDEDYWHHSRKSFRKINQLLSHIQLVSLKSLPTISCEDVIDNNEACLKAFEVAGSVDKALLHELVTSRLAPEFSEKIRNSLLHRLENPGMARVTPGESATLQAGVVA